MKKVMKLTIVQPVVASYRVPIFEELARNLEHVTLYAGAAGDDFGEVGHCQFESVQVPWKSFGPFKVMPYDTLKGYLLDDSSTLHVADFKFLSLWLKIIVGLFTRRKVWLHGQGGYKKSGFVQNVIYIISVFMSTGYICYTHYSVERLKAKLPRFLHKKVHVVENTLYLDAVPEIVTPSTSDLFYIGRLREGCGLDFLLEAAAKADVNVRIIGSGDLDFISSLKNQYTNAIFYGKIFARDRQLDVARDCLAGAYGGDAGLSVVHYMAFGLPVIVHRDIAKHMGPEPSYIDDGVNGLLFDRGDTNSLASAIVRLKQNLTLRNQLAKGALQTFNALASPTMAEKFLDTMELR